MSLQSTECVNYANAGAFGNFLLSIEPDYI